VCPRLLHAALAALALALADPAAARTLAEDTGPANLPPSGFKGGRFVDNTGCVYLRAGYAGRVEWVPQVTRDQQLVCGFAPTFGAGAAAIATSSATARGAPADAPRRTGTAVHRQTTRPPAGYKAAWDDGRLNPQRGPAYAIQVGAFSDPANAARAVDRLAAMGLPAQTAGARTGGRDLTVVFAAPVYGRTSAKAAVAALRNAGFSGAFLRDPKG
jgi:cell division septation protein DedD